MKVRIDTHILPVFWILLLLDRYLDVSSYAFLVDCFILRFNISKHMTYIVILVVERCDGFKFGSLKVNCVFPFKSTITISYIFEVQPQQEIFWKFPKTCCTFPQVGWMTTVTALWRNWVRMLLRKWPKLPASNGANSQRRRRNLTRRWRVKGRPSAGGGRHV